MALYIQGTSTQELREEVRSALSESTPAEQRNSEISKATEDIGQASAADLNAILPMVIVSNNSASSSTQTKRYATLLLYAIARNPRGPVAQPSVSEALKSNLSSRDLPILRGSIFTLMQVSEAHPEIGLPPLQDALNREPTRELVGTEIMSALLAVAPSNPRVQQTIQEYLSRPGQTEQEAKKALSVLAAAHLPPHAFQSELLHYLEYPATEVRLSAIAALQRRKDTSDPNVEARLRAIVGDPKQTQSVQTAALAALQTNQPAQPMR